jgi:predicted metal-dependent peptidase
MSDPLENKLCAARTRLILDKPFLGALVLRLPLAAADPKWCQTTATDARKFYYNPEYIDALSLEQTQFVLAHEALHCALSHFARRQHRVKRRWDVACDYAINPLLLKDGLTPPPGVLVQESFEGMTAEDIYPCIDENTDDKPMDRHVYDQRDDGGGGERSGAGREQQPRDDREEGEQPDAGGSEDGGDAQTGARAEVDPSRGGAPQPPPLTAGEQDALAVQWQQRLAGAAQQAMQAGKLGGAMARMVDHMLQPQLPWRMLLARYLSGTARDDYSYMRPSNRREGSAILPSLRSAQIDVAVALDTSGSISDPEIQQFLAEVDGLKGRVRARLTLFACDAELQADAPWSFEPWEELRLPAEIHGGGGTRFSPVFDWLACQGREPDLLVYFTDAQGEFPPMEPAYPVIWLVKGRAKVPWGQRIQLN